MTSAIRLLILITLMAALVSACDTSRSVGSGSLAAPQSEPDSMPATTAEPLAAPVAAKNLYFGDLHVHTAISMDSILWGNRNGMEQAYAFAKGEPIKLATGTTSQISTPLDFVAITDHASSFETSEFCFSGNSYPGAEALCERFKKPSNAYFELAMKRLRQRPVVRYSGFCDDNEDDCLHANAKTWQRVQAAANAANEPGKFTAFIAYEFSPALPKQGKIHRNVFFRGTEVPGNALSIYDAATEVDLWKSLKSTCVDDCDFLTIPHNLNLTWGYGFAMQTIDGDLYSDADLALRAASEPLAEIFQSKGASECALGLGSTIGATDEECAFEQILTPCDEGESEACALPGSFIREGLKAGLKAQRDRELNPFKVGFIGSTDTHNSNPGDTEENDYEGAMGMMDNTAEKRYKRDQKRHPKSDRNVLYYNPGGLAAIWAPENTRASLFDAMRRREAYATSGTRIALKFYGGWGLDASGAGGVPMGGDLNQANPDEPPEFFVWAARDLNSAALQKIQLIKGWIENGEPHEAVLDIACAGEAAPDPVTQRCPERLVTVGRTTCASPSTGASELQARWSDSGFDADQLAFYYVRVIEEPVCRWSTHDALLLSRELKPQVSAQIQERAWSSPIWYSPAL